MKKPIEDRHKILTAFLNGEISKQKAAEILGCTTRTVQNYRKQFLEKGIDGEDFLENQIKNLLTLDV